MGRPPLPHSLPRLQVLRRNPLPSSTTLLRKPRSHLSRLPLQPQEASHTPYPQARLNSLEPYLLQRRHCGTYSLPKRCTPRLHPRSCLGTHLRRHIHNKHTLHRFPSLRFRPVVRYADWRNVRVVFLSLVPSPHHTGRGMGLGSEELRPCVGHWCW